MMIQHMLHSVMTFVRGISLVANGLGVDRLNAYTEEMLFGIPKWAVASFSGVGNPFLMGDMKPGETVLDIGCGSGMDALIAARQVGERGQVIGIDMTAAMIERAQQNVMSARAFNTRIEWG